MERLRAVNPGIMSGSVPYRNAEHRELYLSGLRLAAGEAVRAREKPATVLECEPAGYAGYIRKQSRGAMPFFSERLPPSLRAIIRVPCLLGLVTVRRGVQSPGCRRSAVSAPLRAATRQTRGLSR